MMQAMKVRPAFKVIVRADEVEPARPDDGTIRCLVADPAPPLRVGDVFDLMRLQAARAGGVCPLSDAQILMGRTYRALVERHEAGAVRCSSVEAMGGGGGGSPDAFIQSRIDASRQIAMLRARVGDGFALEVRRVRPSARGERLPILAIELVDAVALQDSSVTSLLKKKGWAGNADQVKKLVQALGSSLEIMAGECSPSGIKVMRTDLPPSWPLR